MAVLKDTTVMGNLAVTGMTSLQLQAWSETVIVKGSISGAQSIDLTAGNIVTATITAATTFSFTNVPTTGKAVTCTMILTNGGAYVTWPTGTIWAGNISPSLSATGVDIVTLMSVDGGTTWYGFYSGKDFR